MLKHDNHSKVRTTTQHLPLEEMFNYNDVTSVIDRYYNQLFVGLTVSVFDGSMRGVAKDVGGATGAGVKF